MPTPKIVSKVYLETFCHATEEEEKVLQAFLALIPEDLRKIAEKLVTKEILEGHYGNPIIIFRLEVSDQAQAQTIVSHLLKNLSQGDFEYILSTLDLRSDGKGNIYMRINKQHAYAGQFIIDEYSDDIIKIRITLLPHLRKNDDLIASLRKLRA